jgi:CDP-diacylglycerol--glycerol-3-phosphate 3-phosphatidyltransferase
MTKKLVQTADRKFTCELSYVAPSAVSVLRILLAALVIVLIARYPASTAPITVLGIIIVFSLDAFDGVLARWLNSQTLIGSFIDIAADRAVEFIFLQHFLSARIVPMWFVAAFYGRILLTDACRVLAFGMEKVSATGIDLPPQLRALVLSKISRTGYGAIKAVFFGTLLLGQAYGHSSLLLLERASMLGVLAFSLLRATPILFTYVPRVTDLKGSKLRAYTHPKVHDVAPRSTKVVSCLQLASDVGLATWILLIGWR